MKRYLAYVSALVFTLAVGIGTSMGQSAPSVTCYATPGGPTGSLYTIDLVSGAGTLVGATGTGGLPGLAVDPSGTLYATTRYTDTPDGSILYVVNTSTGAVSEIGDTGISGVDALAFDDAGVLYAVDDVPALYTINTATGAPTEIAELTHWYAGLAFDSTNGMLYGSTGGAFGQDDQILTIDPTSGAESLIGVTGLGGATPDIALDADGNLFGFKGGGLSGTPSGLISIDKGTAEGTVIGSVGYSRMSGFTCYSADGDGPTAVFIDIKPGACPNQLNVNANNTVNVAILGTADFDVEDIDVSSLTLAGQSPVAYEYVDVSQPPLDEGPCACTTDGADGFVDLQLKFKNQDLLATLGDLEDEDEFTLTMEGALNDETTDIAGEDCIVIKVPGGKSAKGDENTPLPASFALEQNYPNPFNPTTSIAFSLPAETFVDLAVYNTMGQRVATLVSSTLPAGRHTVQWSATDDLGHQLSSGLYIYRIAAGEFVQTQKMLLLE